MVLISTLGYIDVLIAIRMLGQSIREGDTAQAMNWTSKLAEQHIQLKAIPWNKEDEYPILYAIKKMIYLFLIDLFLCNKKN